MSDKSYHNESVREGLAVQEDDISRWAHKLNAQCYLAVCEEAKRRNELLTEFPDATFLNVWRGNYISEFISNWGNKK